MYRTVLSNRTPKRVELRGMGRTLDLAPLEQRWVDSEDLAAFDLDALRSDERVELAEAPAAAAVRWWAPLGLLVFAPLVLRLTPTPWDLVSISVLFVVVGVAVARTYLDATELWRRSVQWTALALVIAIGALVPGVALLVGTDLRGIVEVPGLAALWSSDLAPALVARSFQWGFIALAATVPALLFFLFDRVQLATLRDRLVVQLFRLDPTLRDLRDVEVRYGRDLEEVYGRPSPGVRRMSGARRSPVVLASVLFTVGWTLVLLNASVSAADLGAGGEGVDAEHLAALLRPMDAVVAYAFLGAYVFAVQAVVRGYIRGDLRPKTYSRITARVVTVVVIGFVLGVVFPGEGGRGWLLAFAFVAGMFPDWVLQWLVERIVRAVDGRTPGGRSTRRASTTATAVPSFGFGTPLTLLDEIDVYDRSALADEGITNVEALAHADLIELLMHTRLPVTRVVDWVDQAILCLYANRLRDEQIRVSLFDRLRRHGIRTASGLVTAMTEGERLGDDAADDYRQHLHDRFDLDPARPSLLDLTRSSFEDEEWLQPILTWRRSRCEDPGTETIECPASPPPPVPDDELRVGFVDLVKHRGVPLRHRAGRSVVATNGADGDGAGTHGSGTHRVGPLADGLVGTSPERRTSDTP